MMTTVLVAMPGAVWINDDNDDDDSVNDFIITIGRHGEGCGERDDVEL